MKKTQHFLSITDLSAKEILSIFSLAKKLKQELKKKGNNKELLKGKSLALIFEKQSLRTRISFEIGIMQLGGHAVYLDPRDTGIGVRESEEDIARILSTMANCIAARTYSHAVIEKIANVATIPVINALSDIEHPCQALTDIFTIWEISSKGRLASGQKESLDDLTIAYVGDGDNNVAHSLCLGATMLGMHFRCGSPKGYWMDKKILKRVQDDKKKNIFETTDPEEAVRNADVVVTDTWVSMGDTNKEERLKIFKPYQVNEKLMKQAKKNAIFMHCLPAYRENEVTTEVINGKQSVVFQESENRMHVQKALLLWLLNSTSFS